MPSVAGCCLQSNVAGTACAVRREEARELSRVHTQSRAHTHTHTHTHARTHQCSHTVGRKQRLRKKSARPLGTAKLELDLETRAHLDSLARFRVESTPRLGTQTGDAI